MINIFSISYLIFKCSYKTITGQTISSADTDKLQTVAIVYFLMRMNKLYQLSFKWVAVVLLLKG